MTDADMAAMTLSELEALAKRFGAAVRTIQEAKALLSFGTHPLPSSVEYPLGSRSGPGFDDAGVKSGPLPSSQFTAAESAERERLMRQFREKLPDNIKAMEES